MLEQEQFLAQEQVPVLQEFSLVLPFLFLVH
jgi:hypothetical protein